MKKWLFLITLIILPLSATAAGIEVSPSKLSIEVGLGSGATTSLTASNPTADVQLYEVFTDDFSQRFEITPASFTLESGARKKVEITFTDKEKNEATLQTDISVVAKPLVESRFQANSGVKIPITVEITKSKTQTTPSSDTLYLYIAIVLGVMAIGYWQWKGRVK